MDTDTKYLTIAVVVFCLFLGAAVLFTRCNREADKESCRSSGGQVLEVQESPTGSWICLHRYP